MSGIKKTRVCLMCKETYEYCPSCGRYSSLPTWMTTFHGEECRNLYNTLSDFNWNKITKEEAKQMLLNSNIPPIEKLSENVRNQVNDILGSNSVEISNVVPVDAIEVVQEIDVKEDAITEVNNDSLIIEDVVEEKVDIVNNDDNKEAAEIVFNKTNNYSSYKKKNRK